MDWRWNIERYSYAFLIRSLPPAFIRPTRRNCDIHAGNYHSFSISFDYCEQRDGEERTTSPNKVFEKASSRVLHAMEPPDTITAERSRVRSRTNDVDDANVCVVLAHFYCRKPNWSARVYYYTLLALRFPLSFLFLPLIQEFISRIHPTPVPGLARTFVPPRYG